MELELKHLAPYLPYGLMVQYEGIINGSELSDFDKAFNESLEKESKLLLDSPDERIGFKIGKIRRIEFWDRWANIWVGNKRPKRVLLSEIKPILLPMSSLYTEITHNGKTFIPWKELDWGSWNDEIGYIVAAEYGENPRVAINVLDFIDDYYKLLEWHFDVFGLIDKGLALDKTKIK